MKWTWLGKILPTSLAPKAIGIAFALIPMLANLAAFLNLSGDQAWPRLALTAGFVGAVSYLIAVLLHRLLAPEIMTAESCSSDFVSKRTHQDFTRCAIEVAKARGKFAASHRGSFFNGILKGAGASTALETGSDQEVHDGVVAQFGAARLTPEQRADAWTSLRKEADVAYPGRRSWITTFALIALTGLLWFYCRNLSALWELWPKGGEIGG